VWKQYYNACTVLYSIDIGSVSVFTVQIDDTSENKALLLTQRWGVIFQKWGHGHIGPSNKKVRGPGPPATLPPVPTPMHDPERRIERINGHFTLTVCSLLITSAKEDMYLPVSVCLSDCLNEF